MFETIYYDNFADEYVDKISLYAPPERYIPTIRNNTNSYIEVWDVKDGSGIEKRLDIAYHPDEYYDSALHTSTIKYQCEKNNCRLIMLHCFYIPPDKFDEYVKRFDLEVQYDS